MHLILELFEFQFFFAFFKETNLPCRLEKTFLQNITIWYASYTEIYTCIDVEKKFKFFQKIHLFFLKKLNVLRILLIPVAFYGNLMQIGEKESRSVAYWIVCAAFISLPEEDVQQKFNFCAQWDSQSEFCFCPYCLFSVIHHLNIVFMFVWNKLCDIGTENSCISFQSTDLRKPDKMWFSTIF